METIVFDFRRKSRTDYDWDAWFKAMGTLAKGIGMVFRKEEHFKCKAKSFELALRKEAKERGLSVSVKTLSEYTVAAVLHKSKHEAMAAENDMQMPLVPGGKSMPLLP